MGNLDRDKELSVGSSDNIGKGALRAEATLPQEMSSGAPAYVRTPGSAPRIDIVLQATGHGSHAWSVSHGWVNAARKLGLLHRAFAPAAQWGGTDVGFDDGLYAYLGQPEADIILLLGFDWHSQMLHNNPRWRERWINSPIQKVAYAHESVLRGCSLLGDVAPRRAIISALEVVDRVIYTDIADGVLLETCGKPALWQPFGVDQSVFVAEKPFKRRKARAFFRGKLNAYTNDTYLDRRELVQFLQGHDVVDLLEYRDKPISPIELVNDFNGYQIALNLPSIFSNHPTRVYEALATGCALVTNATGIESVDTLFENGRELIYYQEREELLEVLQSLSRDSDRAHKLARAGQDRVIAYFTLEHHVGQIVDWLAAAPQDCAESKVSSAVRSKPDRLMGQAGSGAKIIIDGVIFDLQNGRMGGISRVWTSLLKELGSSELASDILLLDRAGTAPAIPGLRTRTIDRYAYEHFEDDSLYLQQICEEEGAELFLSTYYSCPERCRSMLLLHDMVPELCGADLQQPEWRAKDKAIRRADAFLSVSQSTANDFRRIYPELEDRSLFITANAADSAFHPRVADEVTNFLDRYGISRPYFLLVGNRLWYKNAVLFFKALSLFEGRAAVDVVCTGSTVLESEFQPYVQDTNVHMLMLGDDELAAAYSGAIALVYPSQYEGFGLPLLEAMQCDCPVITCKNSALVEVAGTAALFVGESDVQGMVDAMKKVSLESVRAALVAEGRHNASRFTWTATGQRLVRALVDTIADLKTRPQHPEDALGTGGRLIRAMEAKFGRTAVLDAMIWLKQMYSGHLGLDYQSILSAEDVVSGMDDAHFEVVRQATETSRGCDAYVCYWMGLASERRDASGAHALQAYWNAIERHDWAAGYRWRVAERAADLAMTVGHPELSVDLLTGMVLTEFPAHPTARNKLRAAEQAANNGRASKVDVPSTRLEPMEDHQTLSAPVVSVIVSVYKADKYLEGCLEDLELQTIARQLEIIVVDSGSPDKEGVIVQAYQQKFGNIRYVRTERRESVYGAWNRALKLARGRYITNANADDRHAPNALEKLVATLDAEPEAGVVYADCAVTRTPNATLKDKGAIGRFRWPDFDRTRLFQVCYIGPQPMWRRALHEHYGLFDDEMESAGDYEFWLRISDKTRFVHIPEVLGLYLQSASSVEHRDQTVSAQEAQWARERYWYEGDGPLPPPEGSFLEWYGPDDRGWPPPLRPLVSVIIPTRNRPDELEHAVSSVLGQSYPNIEIIVVNDGGTDVRAVVNRLNSNHSVFYETISHQSGTGAARNVGIGKARGQYLAFLDDDDVFLPYHIAALVAELEANPALAAVYSDGMEVTVDFADEQPRVVRTAVAYSADFSADELFVCNYIPILCVVARTSAVERAGPFREDFEIVEDWEWLTRLCRTGQMRHLPVVTCEYVVREGAPSRNNRFRGRALADYFMRVYELVASASSPAVRAAQQQFLTQLSNGQAALEKQDGSETPLTTAERKRRPRTALDGAGESIGNLAQVVSAFEQAAVRCADYAPSYANLIITRWATGDIGGALSALQKGLAIATLDKSLVLNGALLLVALGNIQEAGDLCRNFLRKQGMDADVNETLRSLLEEGSVKSAPSNRFGRGLIPTGLDEDGASVSHGQSITATGSEMDSEGGNLLGSPMDTAYRSWSSRRALEEIDGELFAERMMLKWKRRPTMHLLMWFRSGDQALLADTLDSLSTQLYVHWGLTVLADCEGPDAAAFERIPNLEWKTCQDRASLTSMANDAVAETKADWVAVIPAGIQFTPDSLIACADYSNLFPHWRLIYTDSDTIDHKGMRVDPKFRPDFNLDLLRSMPYMGDFCLVRRDALGACGGFAYSGGAQNYDLALKILDMCGEGGIGHIAEILYHSPANSVAATDTESTQKALQEHLGRAHFVATVESGLLPNTFWVRYRHESQPLVSIIIPTRDKVEFLEPCIESLLEKTTYKNYEIIVVDNESEDPDTISYLAELVEREPDRVRVVRYPHPFNYSAISNMAVREARGEYVLFLNNDTQVVQSEWLERMLAHGQRPEVGVVGARLVYPETGVIQHAGVILGIDRVADHIYNGHLDIKDPGYMGRAQVDQNFSAVTAACMLVRRSVFEEVGGMDEDALAVLFNDVDLCLKIGGRGYKIVWTPYATLVHHGSASLINTAADYAKAAEAALRAEKEREAMLRKWLPQIAQDPAYNRHLSLVRTDSVVETQVVPNWDVNFHDRPRILGVPISGGSGDYRVIQPLRALSRSGIAQTEVVFPPGLDQCRILSVSEIARAAPDTLIFQNAVNDHDHEVMRVAKQFTDALRVFALDDLLTKVPPKSSFYRKIVGAYRDIRRRLRKSLGLCDRLVVSTEPLRELCADMIDDIRVIPNYLSRGVWDEQTPMRRERSRPRVGWAGAQQHQGDLELIHDLVRATAGEVDWVFFGMCPDELRSYVSEVHEFEVGFKNYAARLATLDLDLAIAPLEINAFNEAKSNLRLLEYGYFGWPVVCTDILPYQNAPVTRIENDAQQWIQAIRERVHDLEALRREGEVLQTWVHRHWMLEDHLDLWRDALISRETVALRKAAGNV